MAAEHPIQRKGIEQTPLGAAWRFRRLVLLLALAGAGLAFVYANYTATVSYQAIASLVVSDPRASTLFSADQAASDASLYVEDQIAILRSDSVAQRAREIVASETGIQIDPLLFEETVEVYTTTGNEILIEYAADNETVAVTAVNAIVTAYSDVRGEAAAEDSASAIAQLDQSITKIDVEIDIIGTSISEYRASRARSDLDQQYEDALARMAELQARLPNATADNLERIRQELADIDQLVIRYLQVTGIEADDPELARLVNEQLDAINRRSSLAEQRDRLLVDTELLSGGISLYSPAQFAIPDATSVPFVSILGGVLGLLAGAGISYVLALRRRKFDERAQPGWVLESSMLAEIPTFSYEGIRGEMPMLDHPGSASAEAFRFAATALELGHRRPTGSGDGQPHTSQSRTYLITSAGPTEGKTVITANLALAAAREGHRVLAIDADFGHQRLTELLSGDAKPASGITEVVETGLDIANGSYSLGPPGPLDLMSRGSRPTNAPDFFSLPATRAFFEKVGQLYDMVLIDGPPMLHVAYTSILAQLVDQVIVVTRHGSSVTRLEDLAQRLDLVGTPLAGYVYNVAPLRHEMTLTDGSLKDVLGEAREFSDEPGESQT